MTPINGRGGDRAFPTEERSKPSPEWNHYRIVCQAGSIALSVNGKEVTRGTKATPSKGYICIESEGGVVHYRNVKIKVLPDTPIDDSQVAIAYRGYRSIYSGLDLRDWKPSQEGVWKVNDWVLDHAPDTKSNSNSLTYEKANSIEGFVIDFRLPEEKSSLSLQLPGIQEPLVLSADTASIAKSLVQRGSWNRIEGSITREGSQAKLTFVLNGDSHAIQGQPAEQSLRIDATHKVSLANIYIR